MCSLEAGSGLLLTLGCGVRDKLPHAECDARNILMRAAKIRCQSRIHDVVYTSGSFSSSSLTPEAVQMVTLSGMTTRWLLKVVVLRMT